MMSGGMRNVSGWVSWLRNGRLTRITAKVRAPRRAIRIARANLDPVESWLKLLDRAAVRRESKRPRSAYAVDADWEAQLHAALGLPWPCLPPAELDALWAEVTRPLLTMGLTIGPASFGMWNDGEPEMVRALWRLVRCLQPATVIETGVARGFTSRFILEALERNGHGYLWSIDLPPMLHPDLHAQVGIAVPAELRSRWSYVRGSSRRRLPALLRRVGSVDLFIHDSLHSERNVSFELDHVWKALRPGGAMIVDDIDLNFGFQSFTKAHPDHLSLVCQSLPMRPDLRRADGKGLFGIVIKSQETSA
jgi:predicted O-methyltransferase YrrM